MCFIGAFVAAIFQVVKDGKLSETGALLGGMLILFGLTGLGILSFFSRASSEGSGV